MPGVHFKLTFSARTSELKQIHTHIRGRSRAISMAKKWFSPNVNVPSHLSISRTDTHSRAPNVTLWIFFCRSIFPSWKMDGCICQQCGIERKISSIYLSQVEMMDEFVCECVYKIVHCACTRDQRRDLSVNFCELWFTFFFFSLCSAFFANGINHRRSAPSFRNFASLFRKHFNLIASIDAYANVVNDKIKQKKHIHLATNDLMPTA